MTSATDRLLLNEAYRLLTEALSLMDVPEQYQDDDWYERRKAIEDAVLAFEGKGAMGVGDQHSLTTTSGPDTAPMNTVSHPKG